jgi:predicted TIM-barrel fold metal-dependent hydrolase
LRLPETVDAVGALPFLVGRRDQCWENIPAAAAKTKLKPSHYARRIYADSVVFRQDVLEMAVSAFGSEDVMYGSNCRRTIGDPFESGDLTSASLTTMPNSIATSM